MKIKKFVASNMTEAMNLIKKEFGDDAMILNTKNIKPSEAYPKPMLEVTAAIDKKEEPEQTFEEKIVEATKKSKPNSVSNYQFNVIKKEMDYISERIDSVLNHIKYENLPHIPKALQLYAKKMIQNDVHLTFANKIVEDVFTNLKGEELLDKELIEKKLFLKIKNQLLVSPPMKFNKNNSKVISFVGPTGVGKTTTVSKIAAIFQYKYSKKTAILSIDSFRIAAMDQLKSFAEIAGIRFEAVYNPEDMNNKIEELSDFDLILIDTPGLNPRETAKLNTLKDILKVSRSDEIHLILSMTTKEKDIKDVIKSFEILPIKYLIFSKIDETNSHGSILNISNDLSKPVSYVTTGQGIPEDLMKANREMLAQFVLNGREFLEEE